MGRWWCAGKAGDVNQFAKEKTICISISWTENIDTHQPEMGGLIDKRAISQDDLGGYG